MVQSRAIRTTSGDARVTGQPTARAVHGYPHDALFYDSADDLVEVAMPFLTRGLEIGDAAVIAAGAAATRVLCDALDGDPRVHVLERGDVYNARTATAITTYRRLAEREGPGAGEPGPRRRRDRLRPHRPRPAGVAALRGGHQRGPRRLAAERHVHLRHRAPAGHGAGVGDPRPTSTWPRRGAGSATAASSIPPSTCVRCPCRPTRSWTPRPASGPRTSPTSSACGTPSPPSSRPSPRRGT